MSIYNIPPAGQVSDEIEALRTKRTEFAHARGQLMYTLQDQIALAAATSELLDVIQKLLSDDYVVPMQIRAAQISTESCRAQGIGSKIYGASQESAPEELPGTLPPFVMAHADKLQALANAYGYQICMHPKLTDHGRLYSYWAALQVFDEVQQA